MEPKAGENDAANTATEADKARKPRPPIDIDLPPSAVKEQPGETPKTESPAASAEPVPRVKSPKLLPSLLGLVAGAIGGFGAWTLAGTLDGGVGKVTASLDQRIARLETARPPAPSDLADRLTRAERNLSEAPSREQALRAEIGKLQAAIAAEQAERAKALNALAERSGASVVIQAPPGTAAEAQGELERLKARLSALESGTRPLSDAIGTVAARNEASATRVEAIVPRLDEMQARLEGFAPRLTSVSDQVSALSKTLSGVATRDDLTRASAMLVTTGLLGEAFQRLEPLGGVIETLRAMGAGDDVLGPLLPFANVAPVSPQALLAELRGLAAKAPAENTPSGDFFERMRAGAANLVDIRRTGEITGTDDAAHLARAEQTLQRGDVATAVTLVARLTPARAEAFAGWRAKAEQRTKALEAIGKLRSDSLARLSRAASGAR